MNKTIEFSAEILANDKGGAYVLIPFDVEKTYGKKRVKIKAWLEDIPYRGTLVRMGSPAHILIVKKDIRAQIGKQSGDVVNIKIMEDTEPRVIEIPTDFKKLLSQKEAVNAFFEKLSYTHQKEYVNWIINAKKQETRERRMKKAIEMMEAGKKRV